MADNVDVPMVEPVLEDQPIRDIPMDIQWTREETRTPAEWLVLFRNTRPATYDGTPQPTYLDMWISQLERIVKVSRVPQNLWVPFATIQLKDVASRWWRDMEADPHTTTCSSFTGALEDMFGPQVDPR